MTLACLHSTKSFKSGGKYSCLQTHSDVNWFTWTWLNHPIDLKSWEIWENEGVTKLMILILAYKCLERIHAILEVVSLLVFKRDIHETADCLWKWIACRMMNPIHAETLPCSFTLSISVNWHPFILHILKIHPDNHVI